MTTSESGQRQNIQSEVAFFDEFAGQHGDYDVLSEKAYERLLGIFRERVRPRPGERCIDLGCGTGAFTRRLRGFGLALHGMDISPRSVDVARSHGGEEQYLCGDITRTELQDGSFDIVLYSGVLHHFDSEKARMEVLREGQRLLAKRGRLFAYDPNLHSPSMWLYRDPRSPLFSDEGKTENEVLLSREQLSRELANAGFSRTDVRGVSGIAFKFVESKRARLILPVYNLYEELVRWSPFEHRIGTFLVSVAFKE